MTTQIKDVLIYNGKEYGLNGEILEYYFKDFPEKKPGFETFMTALWRGYEANFEVRDNQLFINQIDWFAVEKDFSPEDFLKENFPGNKYSWFSGLVRIDVYRGNIDDETNENAIYELLEFKKGDLVNHWKLTHPEFLNFKGILFENFKKTIHYNKLFNLWRTNNPDLEKDKIDGYIYDSIISNVREL